MKLLVIVYFLFPVFGNAQDAFFNNPDQALHAVIEADFSILKKFPNEMFKDVQPKEFEVPAKMTLLKKVNDWNDDLEEIAVLDIGLRPRGLTRNFDCKELPPFRVVFDKAQLKETILEGASKKMKFVSYCKSWAGEDVSNTNSQSAQNVSREFYIYRYMNLMGVPSFRIRLLKIKYIDSTTGDDSGWTYGFALESKKVLAKRLGMKRLEVEVPPCLDGGTERCHYTSQKFRKADMQYQALKNNYSNNMNQWYLMQAQYNILLNPLNASSDHPFGGNNSFVLFNENEDGKKDYLVIPYDFDRNSKANISYSWFKKNIGTFLSLGNHQEAMLKYDFVLKEMKLQSSRLKKIIKSLSDNIILNTLPLDYQIYDNEISHRNFVLELEVFKIPYLKNIRSE